MFLHPAIKCKELLGKATMAYDMGSVKMFLYVLNVANTGLIFVNSRFWMQGVTLLLHKLEP